MAEGQISVSIDRNKTQKDSSFREELSNQILFAKETNEGRAFAVLLFLFACSLWVSYCSIC